MLFPIQKLPWAPIALFAAAVVIGLTLLPYIICGVAAWLAWKWWRAKNQRPQIAQARVETAAPQPISLNINPEVAFHRDERILVRRIRQRMSHGAA